MSTNIQDLSNAEMRNLINQLILNDSGSEKLTKNLIDMEAQVLFGSSPIFIPNTAMGSKVLGKLNSKLLYKSFAKWFIGSIITVGIGTTSIYLYQQQNNSDPVSKSILPITENFEKEKDSISTELLIEHDLVTSSNAPISPKVEGNKSFIPLLPIKKINELEGIKRLPSEIIVKNNKAYLPNADTEMQFSDIHSIKLSAEFTNIQIIGIPGNKTAQVQLIGKKETEIDQKSQFEIIANSENGELIIDIHDKSKKKFLKNLKKIDPVDLILKVTGNVNLEINNSSGEINVQGITGEYCKINNNYGKVNLEKINAVCDLQLESGNIQLTELSGNSKIQCNFGNVNANQFQGNLELSINSGNFNSESHKGNANIEVNYGNVSMNKSSGSQLKVNTNSGDFTLLQSQFMASNINLDYGNLKLTNTESDLNLSSNSGNITIDQHQGMVLIKSDYGNLDIKNQLGNISIQSNSGKILLENIKGDLQISADYSNVNLSGLIGDIMGRIESGNFMASNVSLIDQAQLSNNFGNIKLQTNNKLEDLSYDLNAESGHIKLSKESTEILKSNGKIQLDKGTVKISIRVDSGNIILE